MLRDVTLALRLCWQKNSKRLLDARLVISPSLIGSGEECSIKEHGGIKRKSKSCYCFFVQTRGLWNRMSENKIFTVGFFFQFRDRIKQVKILESVILISNFDQVQESLTFFFISQEQLIISAIFMVTNTCK